MSFPRYPEYKDSGDAALGQIPSHWRVARIGDVAKVVNGYPFDSALFHDDGAYPLIRIRDLGVSETATRYSGDFVETAAVTSSDVLIGMDGDFNVGRWLGTGAALLNQRMCCIRTPSPELTKLLEYALPQPLRVINDLTYATTVKHLSSSQIEKIRVALALDRDELRAIVRFLDRETAKIDALVAEQEKLIGLLQEKRQAVISHAVTKGLDPNVPMKDSGVEWLGEVPGHWEVKRVKHVKANEPNAFVDGPFGSNLKSEHYVEDGDVYVIESSFATQGVLDISNLKTITHEHFKSIDRSETRVSDIIIAKIGAQFGKCSILPILEKPAVVSGNSLKLTVNTKVQNVELMRWQLVNLKQQGAIDLIVNLTAQPALSLASMNDLPILVPPMAEQIQIVGTLALKLEQYESLVSEARIAITLLQERRTALISAAVTGQIDVRGLAGGANAPDLIAASAYAESA